MLGIMDALLNGYRVIQIGHYFKFKNKAELAIKQCVSMIKDLRVRFLKQKPAMNVEEFEAYVFNAVDETVKIINAAAAFSSK